MVAALWTKQLIWPMNSLDRINWLSIQKASTAKKENIVASDPACLKKESYVLLVDEFSASASEVLAGALQDWCRATSSAGEHLGKDWCRNNMILTDGSAIRLTVARYYTPFGRSIQRSYEKGKKVYMDEIWERFSNGEDCLLIPIRSITGNIFDNTMR